MKDKTKSNIEMLLINFVLIEWNYQVSFWKRKLSLLGLRLTKIQEHMLVVIDKSTHEEYISQPLQDKNKQFKLAVTFLTVHKGIFNIADKNKNF